MFTSFAWSGWPENKGERMVSWIFYLTVCNWIAQAPTAPSVEEAEKDIVRRFSAIDSLSATITNEETQETSGKLVKVQIVRQVEWMRSGAAFLYRSVSTSTTTQKEGTRETRRVVKTTTVSDGAKVVSLVDSEGHIKAVQRRADVTVTPDVGAMFEELRKDSKLNRFPDVVVGRDSCYAIQVLPKERKGSDLLQTMIYFRKDIGLDVRTVVYNKDNKVMFSSTTTDVKVNPKLSRDLFVLTIPNGVELIDESR